MERATQRWLIILGGVVALYLVLLLSHSFLGVKVVPW
jgi:type IV secretory pathway TrbL component